MASEEETIGVDVRSTVFMTILLSSGGSTLLETELKRIEIKEHDGA